MDQGILTTVDVVLFCMDNNELKTLLVKRKYEPFKGSWALPGGFIDKSETTDQAAKRELKEETGIDAAYLEQLYTFGGPDRDPRGHVITIAYFALLRNCPDPISGSDAAESEWHSIKKLPNLAFDHKEILKYAIERLQNKFEYTTASFNLLPTKFTLTELQRVYEEILGKELDKRNFRKKILSLDILEATGDMRKQGASRPAELYKLSNKKFTKLKDKGILFPF